MSSQSLNLVARKNTVAYPILQQTTPMIKIPRAEDFGTAALHVIHHLQSDTELGFWLAGAIDEESCTIVALEGNEFPYSLGESFDWSMSELRLLHEDHAFDLQCPDYERTAISIRDVSANGHLFIPVMSLSHEIAGFICGLDSAQAPMISPDNITRIQLFAELLSSIRHMEQASNRTALRAEMAYVQSLTDPLTRIYNRRGWDMLLSSEDARVARHKHPTSILVIDLDRLKWVNDTLGHSEGDKLIKNAAAGLVKTVREQDVVARVGGDEFVVLAVETDLTGGERLRERLYEAFQAVNVEASIGLAWNDKSMPLPDVWQTADDQMYEVKLSRKAARTAEQQSAPKES